MVAFSTVSMDSKDSKHRNCVDSKACQWREDSWSGCDWPTEFGSKKLNLCGLTSQQALLVANATRGDEAECWREAASWLHQIESDAAEAGRFIERAGNAEVSGDLALAEHYLVRAAGLENRYRSGGEIQTLLERFRRRHSS